MRYLLSVITVLAGFMAFSQDAQTEPASQDSIPFELRKQAYIYTLAQKYNDPAVARMALYNLIAVNPNSAPILDSLALLYYQYQQYASAALVAKDAMMLNPEDAFAAEVSAVSFENLGVKNRAADSYEKLYLLNNDLGTLYKLAFLQMDLKRYGEAIANADVLIESPKAVELKLLFPVDDKKNQEISMKAAAVRLKGMIEEDKGNKAEAKKYYQEALTLEPEFAVLKQQITDLDKEGK